MLLFINAQEEGELNQANAFMEKALEMLFDVRENINNAEQSTTMNILMKDTEEYPMLFKELCALSRKKIGVYTNQVCPITQDSIELLRRLLLIERNK